MSLYELGQATVVNSVSRVCSASVLVPEATVSVTNTEVSSATKFIVLNMRGTAVARSITVAFTWPHEKTCFGQQLIFN